MNPTDQLKAEHEQFCEMLTNLKHVYLD